MKLFKKKTTIIKAEQWFPDKEVTGVFGSTIATDTGEAMAFIETSPTRIGRIMAGDWIIAEPDGRGFYICSSAEFEATYEPA